MTFLRTHNSQIAWNVHKTFIIQYLFFKQTWIDSCWECFYIKLSIYFCSNGSLEMNIWWKGRVLKQGQAVPPTGKEKKNPQSCYGLWVLLKRVGYGQMERWTQKTLPRFGWVRLGEWCGPCCLTAVLDSEDITGRLLVGLSGPAAKPDQRKSHLQKLGLWTLI